MQISIEVTPPMQHEAEMRGLPIGSFIQQLLDLGMSALQDQTHVRSAMERIRALRQSEAASPAPRG